MRAISDSGIGLRFGYLGGRDGCLLFFLILLIFNRLLNLLFYNFFCLLFLVIYFSNFFDFNFFWWVLMLLFGLKLLLLLVYNDYGFFLADFDEPAVNLWIHEQEPCHGAHVIK